MELGMVKPAVIFQSEHYSIPACRAVRARNNPGGAGNRSIFSSQTERKTTPPHQVIRARNVHVRLDARALHKSSDLDKDHRISVVRMPPPVGDVIPLDGNKASLLPVIGQICSCTNGGGGGAPLLLSFPDCPAGSRSIHFRGRSY